MCGNVCVCDGHKMNHFHNFLTHNYELDDLPSSFLAVVVAAALNGDIEMESLVNLVIVLSFLWPRRHSNPYVSM